MDNETKLLLMSEQKERMEYMKRYIASNPVGRDIDIEKCDSIINGIMPYNEFDAEFKVECVDDIINAVYEYGSMLVTKESKRPAKVRKCRRCGTDMEFNYSELLRMSKKAKKYKNYHIPKICKECQQKKKEGKVDFKKLDKPVIIPPSVTIPNPIASEEARQRIYKENIEEAVARMKKNGIVEIPPIHAAERVKPQEIKPVVTPIIIKSEPGIVATVKTEPASIQLDMGDILKDAVREVRKERHTKIKIQREIEPMQGNSLANLLKDIKL